MQPDASYSHLRGRTRGPLPLLCDYTRASRGKPVDWLKRDERRKLVGTLEEDRMTNVHDVTLCEWLDRDRSGWCIGTNAFAIKTDTTTRVYRGNGTSSCDSRLPAARGVWIWAKENDMGGSFRADVYTSPLYVFSWNFCCSVNDCFFLFFLLFFLLVCLSFWTFSLGPTCERMDSWQTSRREGFYGLASRTSPVIDDWTLGDWLRLFFRGTWEIGGISFFILDTGSWNVKGEELAVNDSDNGLILSTDCHRISNFSRILPNSTATKNEDRDSKRQFDTHKNLQIFQFFLSQIFNKYEKFSCLLKRVYIKQYI